MTCMTDEIDHWPVLKEMFCHFMDLMAERCLLRSWVGDVMYGSLSTREKEAGVGGGGWAHDGGRHGCHMVLREPWDRHSDIILRRGAQTSLKFWLSLTPQTRKSSPSERNPEADSDKRPRDLFWRWVSRCVARPSNLLSHSDTFFVFFKKKEKQICPCLCAPLRLLLQRHHKIFIHGKISLIPASRVTCRDGFHAPGLKSAQTCNPNSECKGFSSAPPRSAPSRGTPRGASAPSRSFSGGRTQAEDVRSFSNRWVAFLFLSFFNFFFFLQPSLCSPNLL